MDFALSEDAHPKAATLRVLAIVPALLDTSPGQRFRIEQWDPVLQRMGIHIDFAPFQTAELQHILPKPGHRMQKMRELVRSWRSRSEHVANVHEYDLVYIFRECALVGLHSFETRIANAAVPIVYDFDDAVFVSYVSPSNGIFSWLKFAPQKTRTLCRLADHVMAGNEYLAEYARKYNQHVTVVPTTIDLDKYTQLPTAQASVPVIGWSGSHSTVAYLKEIAPALQELAKTDRFKFRVIGAAAYALDGVDVEALPWRSDSEVLDLRAIDIGIMPLPDDRWARGKCALKALQYMALAKPAVCSPVGVNSNLVRDGENGLLANSHDEWVTQLRRLLRNPEERRAMGQRARHTVESWYSGKIQAPRVASVFRAVAEQAQANKPGHAVRGI